MSTSRLYDILVPDAPLNRRTDRDPVATPFAMAERAPEFNPAFLETLDTPGVQEPALVSSYAGIIQQILLAFPAYGVQDPASAAAYRSVIGALRPGTRFVVVHHESHRAPVEAWFQEAGHAADAVTYVSLPDYVRFTDWAEDGYVALRDASENGNGGGPTYLMEPWTFPRAGDALIADAVEEYAPVRGSQAPLIFQGGNCLIGDDFWLLGKDYFADSMALAKDGPVKVPDGTTAEAFVREMFRTYVDARRTLLLVGTEKEIPLRTFYGTREGSEFYLDMPAEGVGTYQPIFHIDMLVTLIGRTDDGFECLVGSPGMADDILGRRSPFALQDVYDTVAKDLTKAGMRVHRNPLVHWPTLGEQFTVEQLRDLSTQPGNESLGPAVKELRTAGATPSTRVRVRTWHHITWNNCLVENDGGQNRAVYLPTFGHGAYADLAVIDDRMEEMWRQLGFDVHRLADFTTFAERQGVVHCIKKYLQRSAA
jgi:hypothetical protein